MEPTVSDRSPPRHSPEGFSFVGRILRNSQNVRLMLYGALVLCDVTAIRTAFIVGAQVRGPKWLGTDVCWVIIAIYLFFALRQGGYSLAALRSRLDSVWQAGRCFLLATVICCTVIYFLNKGDAVSRLALATAFVLSLALIALFRVIFLTVFVGRDASWTIGELLILDGGKVPPGYHGAVLDARAEGFRPGVQDPRELSRLAEAIEGYDRILVACVDEDRRGDWAQMLKCYHVTGEVVLDGGTPLGAIAVGRFRGRDTVVVARDALSLGNRIKKRLMDIAVSVAGLILLAPLLIVVAIAIKLDSHGPVLFAQPRMGRGNRPFRILKFRSMRAETSDLAGARSTSRNDSRVTRVGRIIRATSIDELPQLLNVLKGDMSIVGPRPHALGSLAGEKLFWEVDRAYWRRHTLRPGITGLAQVRGFRGATHQQADLTDRLQSDLEYISGWSLWRDIKILISTARVVVHPSAF